MPERKSELCIKVLLSIVLYNLDLVFQEFKFIQVKKLDIIICTSIMDICSMLQKGYKHENKTKYT